VVKHLNVVREHLQDRFHVTLVEGVGELLRQSWISFTLMVVFYLLRHPPRENVTSHTTPIAGPSTTLQPELWI
jgi:hypothetical protein